MKTYVTTVISSLIVILIIFTIADLFDIEWLQGSTIRILLIFPVTFVISWIISYIQQKRRLN
ncbi:hypothetical protein COA23_20670 [Priestia megaterium]|nr:hypothetical protein CN397_23445 [Priestia megaterium]PFQ80845.1 hypothetical protein COK11_19600 [Priestia megaterium]PGR03955.1 hypothetical protein COA23_20670 [Priestia megaterium]